MISANESRLQQVGTEKIIPLNAPQTSSPLDKLATDMILFGIKTLSQRTLCALGQCFTIFCVLSMFVLCYLIAANPTPTQLVEEGIYGAFILLLHWVKRKG